MVDNPDRARPCPVPPLMPISSAQQAVYDQSRLSHSRNAIRLLRIDDCFYTDNDPNAVKSFTCSFEIRDLYPDNEYGAARLKPDYTALSYVWGDDESFVSGGLSINGVSWPVKPNLHDALRHIWDEVARQDDDRKHRWAKTSASRSRLLGFETADRLPKRPLVWIDFLCIAQNNNAERNHQVARMKAIYEQASNVAVWLGKEDQCSNLIVDFFNFIHGKDISTQDKTKNILDKKYKTTESRRAVAAAVGQLFTNEYWKRMWTLQEWVLAKQALVFLGQRSFISSRNRRSYFWWRDVLFHWADMHTAFNNLTGSGWKTFKAGGRLPFNSGSVSWRVLFCVENKEKKCRDPRDRIFGSLGLTDGISRWPDVDYGLSVEDLYASVLCTYADMVAYENKWERLEATIRSIQEFSEGLIRTLIIDPDHPVVRDGKADALDHVRNMASVFGGIPGTEIASLFNEIPGKRNWGFKRL